MSLVKRLLMGVTGRNFRARIYGNVFRQMLNRNNWMPAQGAGWKCFGSLKFACFTQRQIKNI